MILISLSCAWVLGIALGFQFSLPAVLICSGFIPLPFIFISKKYRAFWVTLALCLAILFGGASYYPSSAPTIILLPQLDDQNIEIRGTISAEPEARDNITRIELNAEQIKLKTNWQKIQGKLLLFVPRYPEYQYGDVLWIQGKIETTPRFDSFDYQSYLARQGIFLTMFSPQVKVFQRDTGIKPLGWIYTFRKHLSEAITRALPEPQAALCQGIVLGIRSTIPDTLKYNFSVTGTAQLLAISGINLSIIAGILVAFGIWIFGRRYYIYVWLALLIIWFYSLITGMEAPVIRSAIMASLFLIAELLGRQKNAFVAISLGAAVMVGLNPQILWNASFQLSFLAMAGLIFIAPPLQQWSHKTVINTLGEEGITTRISSFISDSFIVTLAAIIAVLPLTAYYFGVISLISPVANLLISPSLPAIIISGSITALIGLFSTPAAQIIGWITWLFLSYMLWSVNFFASLPGAFLSSNPINPSLVWLYYATLSLVIWLKTFYRKVRSFVSGLNIYFTPRAEKLWVLFCQTPKKWIIVPLLLVAFLASFTAATMPDSQLHVSILNVGEGDAILIQNDGQNVLIDGGPSPQAVCQALSNKTPFWERSFDLVILTHPHEDHLCGLVEVLKRYKVKRVLTLNLNPNTSLYHEWVNTIQIKDIPYNLARAGQQISLANNVNLDVLNPSEDISSNAEIDFENKGIVLHLSYNKVSFLFTADIDQEVENKLIRQRSNLKSTVLKVAHHGSATSSSPNFVSTVKPQIAVISLGAANLYNHPDPEVLTRIKEKLGSGKYLFRTDIAGTVEFITNGQQLRVKTEN